MRLADKTNGRWFDILTKLGISAEFLTGNHTPCPMCGGKDRFRWDNRDGRGTFICSGECGAGDGFQLLQLFHGWRFADAANEVEAIVGKCEEREQEQIKSDPRDRLKRVYSRCKKPEPGGAVDQYAKGRGLDGIPEGVFEHPALDYWERNSDGVYEKKGTYPAMVAIIKTPEFEWLSLHITYLQNGKKAPVGSPKKILPGIRQLNGSAAYPERAARKMGIAEGLETAQACSELFGMPVIATLNANLMRHFKPQEGIEEYVIFGDNDSEKTFAGQSAAYQLAEKLSKAGYKVTVKIPEGVNDWLDWKVEHGTGTE